MIALTVIFILLVVSLALWAWLLLTGSRWPATTVTVLAAIYATLYLAGTELLARPKPIGMEMFARGSGAAEILATAVDPGKAVYLWLRLPGGTEPRAYTMPWSDQAMAAVQQARDQAQRTGENMQLEWGDVAVDVEGEFNRDLGAGTTEERGDLPGIFWPFEDSFSDWTGMIHPVPQRRDRDKPRGVP